MVKKVHFLGIGGSGASAAAAIAESQGFEINGCDLDISNEFTTPFESSKLQKGHDPKHLEGIDILATTPAIYSLDPNNPELMEAKKLGLEVLTWQEFMGKYLMKDKFVIAVCGTHGKTTTTAMISKLLEDAGLDPTIVIGAIFPKTSKNYRIGKSKYFIVEADEYNDNYLSYTPDISVVTNIEMDHPEYFKDFEAYKESFKKFLLQTKGVVVANISDPAVGEVVKVAMKSQTSHGRGTNVTYLDYSKQEFNLSLQIPGAFNILNATAAFQVGLLLGISPETIKQSLSSYPGVGRRFEYIGKYNGAQIYSDFGHHPTEIKTTMQAVREKFPKSRILLIYQPHMFTRTKYLFDDFVKVFKDLLVDEIFIMDIYQSREKDLGEVNSKQLVEAVNKPQVLHLPKGTELEIIKQEVQPGDILFFMSAGDTDKLAKQLVSS